MMMIRRIGLFIATNLAVLILLGIVMTVLERFFGIRLGQNGGLLVFAAVFGFGGALISLLMSKTMARMSTGAQVISQPRNEVERWLFQTVQRQAQAAGIRMPEVAIYDAPEINAFATGASRNSSLVAVSTGLLRAMSRDEAEAVLGHEISHVANGDMVTMALIQGVLNTFVFFISRVLGQIIDQAVFKRSADEGPGFGYYIIVMVLEIVFGILASIIAMWFSRQREFRADAGAAAYMGTPRPMVAALRRLGGIEPGELPKAFQSSGISDKPGFMALFSTHPPIEARIAALESRG